LKSASNPVVVAAPVAAPVAPPSRLTPEASRVVETDDLPALDAALASTRAAHAAARARLAQLETEVAAARSERASLEQRTTRQVGTRTAGVDEAQVALRKALADFGRRALVDHQTFGEELAASRASIDALAQAASSRERDVRLHEAAVASFDGAAVKKGYAVAGTIAFLLCAILFGPLLYRSYVGVEPPPLHPTSVE
jgi:hypothetical protein